MQTTPATNLLNEAQRAEARSVAYDLFARLFLESPTHSTWSSITAVPELERSLSLTGIDSDRAASDHFHLFGLNVFPYQGMFLDTGGSLGEQQSGRVLACYQQAGFDLAPDTPAGRIPAGESPDHIGLELAFLSFLSGAEADALQDGENLHVLRIQTLQRDFLDQHVLPWLPVLVQAISQQGLPFYTELAQLSLELVSEHHTALGEGIVVRQAAFALPHLPSLLENEKTGLKDIAAYLLTPAYSGFYLGRDDIARLGRRRQLPRGFGGRLQMLENLLRSAVDYDHLPQLIDDLQALMDGWQSAYQFYAETESAWEPFAVAWLERLESTRAILGTVSAGARQDGET